MKKILSLFMIMVFVFSLFACNGTTSNDENNVNAGTKTEEIHKIGVLVYNITDEEVLSFRQYLEHYIASCFEDVQFQYSQNISTLEDALEFIKLACENGAEGIMSFNSYDLKQEVELCEQYGAYFMLASGTATDEQFSQVEDNEYFLGRVGPGEDIEYQAGADMAQYFVDQKYGDRYFILSGGSSLGNEMHRLRTVGILDKLQENYGVSFDRSSEEIAASTEAVSMEAGNLTVTVCPGYVARDPYAAIAKEEFAKAEYDAALSVLPVAQLRTPIEDSISKLGVVDCYSETNMELFSSGVLDYVTGKYSSLIGPSFAAMYNAVTGYADDFRDNGKAFRITQGFWNSSDLEDYQEKYTFASSLEINAYNYEDLYSVCKNFNADADFEDLKALASAYDFESAKERRAGKN